MTRKEKAREALASQFGKNSTEYKIIMKHVFELDLPSNVEVNLIKSMLDGSMSIKNISKETEMTDAEVSRIEEDIIKRGKPAISEVIDNVMNVGDPKFKKMISKYRPLLVEVKKDNEDQTLQALIRKKATEKRLNREKNLTKILN